MSWSSSYTKNNQGLYTYNIKILICSRNNDDYYRFNYYDFWVGKKPSCFFFLQTTWCFIYYSHHGLLLLKNNQRLYTYNIKVFLCSNTTMDYRFNHYDFWLGKKPSCFFSYKQHDVLYIFLTIDFCCFKNNQRLYTHNIKVFLCSNNMLVFSFNHHDFSYEKPSCFFFFTAIR